MKLNRQDRTSDSRSVFRSDSRDHHQRQPSGRRFMAGQNAGDGGERQREMELDRIWSMALRGHQRNVGAACLVRRY